MFQVHKENLTLWQFENLNSQRGIRHFVTDRMKNENGTEFTLSFSSSPDKGIVRANRAQLAKAMGVEADRLFLPVQVHQTNIVEVTGKTTPDELVDTDALITREPGICIAVMSADCVPILLYDQRNKAIGAVHSGWKGTVARILEKTLQTMKAKFGTEGKDIIAGIGPSVSQESYEVGQEVVVAVKESFKIYDTLLQPLEGGKAKLDLWKANKIQLIEFGVDEQAIEVANLCTVKNNGNFFSARKGDAGRFAAGIVLV